MINIEIKDRNSKIIHLIPKHLQESVALIAKIEGFESIDGYVIQIVKDELESIRDGGEKAEFGNFISDYLEKIILSPTPYPPKHESTTTNNKDNQNNRSKAVAEFKKDIKEENKR